MQSISDNEPLSLFNGVEELAADLFGVASIRHWSAVQRLNENSSTAIDRQAIVDRLFERVEANWARCMSALSRPPSTQNWRWWDPKVEIAPENRSPEVTLEREIVRAARALGRRDWSNQVPIASGIVVGGGDRRRAIDLVHQRAPKDFDFVELKIGSDTPIFAAVEILQYGFVWLLSRRDQDVLGYRGRTLIEASDVQLSVLAPSAYYRGVDLTWLAADLSHGLALLGERHGSVRLGFTFEEFSPGFSWPGRQPVDVLTALESRRKR